MRMRWARLYFFGTPYGGSPQPRMKTSSWAGTLDSPERIEAVILLAPDSSIWKLSPGRPDAVYAWHNGLSPLPPGRDRSPGEEPQGEGKASSSSSPYERRHHHRQEPHQLLQHFPRAEFAALVKKHAAERASC